MMSVRQCFFIIFAIIFNSAYAVPNTPSTAIIEANQTAAKQLKVENCWIRLMPKNLPSAGYLSIQNIGNKPVTLNEIHVPGFGMTMMHETLWKGTASSMVMLNSLTIAAKETVLFTPGGRHFMLEKLIGNFKLDDKIPADLKMSDSSELRILCKVKNAAGA